MKLKEIQTLIPEGESHTLEFKSSTTQRKPAFETVCAFLNSSGGTILIGVKNDGKIIGQEITDKIKQEIAGELSKIEPSASANVKIHYVTIDKKKSVIAVIVKSGDHAPYVYSGRPYERNQNTTTRMKQHRYEQLLVNRTQFNHSWEEYIADKYNINDLDHDEIYQAVSDGVNERRIPASALKGDVNDILQRFNLLEDHKLKNAAVVLFAKQEKMKLVQCLIKMARFKGTDKLGKFIDNQQLYGNAFTILNAAENFLIRHLPIASNFKKDQFKRVDKSALPVFAVREALINAICHRDYKDLAGSIALAIYDDRLEIWNTGLLPSSVSVSSLASTHQSYPRNKLISNVFYARGLIETWGTGTNRMIENCRNEGVPEPIFKEYSGGFAVIFKFKTTIGGEIKLENKDMKLSDRQNEILELFKEFNTMGTNQILAKLHNPPSPRTLHADLNILKKLGHIERLGKGPSTTWKLITQ